MGACLHFLCTKILVIVTIHVHFGSRGIAKRFGIRALLRRCTSRSRSLRSLIRSGPLGGGHGCSFSGHYSCRGERTRTVSPRACVRTYPPVGTSGRRLRRRSRTRLGGGRASFEPVTVVGHCGGRMSFYHVDTQVSLRHRVASQSCI